MGKRGARVTVGTTYETLALLYRHVQADHGLTTLTETWSGTAPPEEVRSAADWLFRGDIALGMNLVPLAHANGWHSLIDLITGVGTTPPSELVATMLRSPDATVAEHRQRDREIARLLNGAGDRAPLLTALHDERFDTSAAKAVLDDPAGAARELARLLNTYQHVVAGRDLREPLDAAAKTAESMLAARSLTDAARELFPQWRFHDLTAFESVVLIPSAAMAPFLSLRLTQSTQALIVYPARTRDQARLPELVAALKALAHPQRLEILRIAGQAPITGHALAKAVGLTEATVHHHTSILRSAGLITSNRDAHRVFLTTVPGALDRLFDELRRAT